jgi:GAF domain-containing protein
MKDNLNDSLIRTYRERLEIAKIYEKKMHAIVETGRNINFVDNITEIMDAMLELAAKITNSEFSSASLMGKTGLMIFGNNLSGDAPAGLPIDAGFDREKGLCGLLMRTKKPYLCNMASGDGYVDNDKRTKYKIRNFISMPILVKNENFIGLFEVYNKNQMELYNENDVDLLRILGSFTAIAVERHRMSAEFGKFGEELEKVIEEVLNTEMLLKDNCKKLTESQTELLNLNNRIKKAAVVAEFIGNSKEGDAAGIMDKIEELKNILKNTDGPKQQF